MHRYVRLAVTAPAALALLLAACSGGLDLSDHAAMHEFADEACAELSAADPGPAAAAALDDVIARAIDAGATEESMREILGEECPATLSAIDAAAE